MPETTGDGANGWGRTLEAATEMTETLRADGWEVVTVRAAHVAPEPPSHGDSDRFGFVYVAQGEDADAFTAAVDRGEFDGYEVFNRRQGTDLYTLTRVTDADRRLAVLLVGAVDLSKADELVETARDRGEMYSHVQLLDGEHLGSFHHDDPAPFLPEEA
ncbi:DUF7529 family protein [Candidatus Halobonum tyrrellensis]|uniref:Uncharacterized protein n=1 Tax=Candidatus Halobonum tyrrellensis G22 TaxID=1324957 RepID=V4HBM2_9EURY|nr:hypothetical protein [Candidatus Halobonum tyrrellensis]ESP88110.1 hypothetical protein K933_10482 [Candidatus Halobonum tyrrellensis G22]